MTYLAFRPTKGSVLIPRLVQFLSYLFDAILLLLLVWNIANLCYPIWGWTTFASLWIGLVTHPFSFWIIERFRVRAFVIPRYPPVDLSTPDREYRLRHLGFLFSVWEYPDHLTLAYYHEYDVVFCLKERSIHLSFSTNYRKWVGWLIALSTDAILLVLLIGMFSACYFHGIGTIVFFAMGLILAFQLKSLHFLYHSPRYRWWNEMILENRKCKTKPLDFMACVLEGPDGELFLTLSKVVEYEHFIRDPCVERAARLACKCCS